MCYSHVLQLEFICLVSVYLSGIKEWRRVVLPYESHHLYLTHSVSRTKTERNTERQIERGREGRVGGGRSRQIFCQVYRSSLQRLRCLDKWMAKFWLSVNITLPIGDYKYDKMNTGLGENDPFPYVSSS